MSDRANEKAREAWKAGETTYDDRAHDVRAPQWEEAAAASAGGGALVAAPEPSMHQVEDDDEPLAAEEVTGNLRRYARWQWKDYWQRRGFWTAGAALLCVWIFSRIAWHTGPGRGPVSPAEVEGMAHALFALGGFAAGLLSTGGLVSREREHGLQRFLFAKPVQIVRYYLQGLAINGVGALVVLAGAVLLASVVLPSAIPVATVLAGAVMAYAAASGATFLLSTLLRWDAPVAAVWVAAGFPIAAAAHEGVWWGVVLQWLFPQGYAMAAFKAVVPANLDSVNRISEILAPLAAAGLVGLAYGLACVAAGVAVLRRRSIQT